jgi:hydrogenase large subunit
MRYFQDKLIANIKAGDTATANTDKVGAAHLAQAGPRASAPPRPRAARSATGWSSRRARSPTTRRGADHLERLAARPEGNIGAFEAALMNTPLAKADEPLEILRTLHSFDPCLACSTHVMGPDGEELAEIKVR